MFTPLEINSRRIDEGDGVHFVLTSVFVCVFFEALRLQPGDALLYKLRADVRARLGWTEQALEDYRTAVELEDPEA